MNVYLDNVGERKEFFLKLDKRFEKMGHDGDSYCVHKMIDRHGRKAMFYRCSGDVDFKEKDCVLVKATVAEHREYNSEPETYLNRVKILRNIGSK
jgi:hypothetical protein|tara:strand:- start:3186 stop:3470 length:285 start_codon:yes stop_codon:yes gene_type:complete